MTIRSTTASEASTLMLSTSQSGWAAVAASELTVEADLSGDFVSACCHVQEASDAVTAVYQELIQKHSGLEPHDAAVAVSMALTKGIGRFFRDYEFDIGVDLVILQTLLSTAQLQLAIAGAVAGVVMDVHSQAVSQGRLRPLAVLGGGGSGGSHTAATFAAFTSGVTMASSLDRFKHAARVQRDASEGLWGVPRKIDWESVHASLGCSGSHVEDTLSVLYCVRARAISLVGRPSGAATMTACNMNNLLALALPAINSTVSCLDVLQPEIINFVRLRRQWASGEPRKVRHLALLFRRRPKTTDDELVKRTSPACHQAKEAASLFQGRLKHALVAHSTEKNEY